MSSGGQFGNRAREARRQLVFVVPGVAAVYIASAWIAVFLYDFSGLRSADALLCRLQDCTAHPPMLWIELFQERSPTEIGQWILLLSASVLSAATAWRLRQQGLPALSYWLLALALLVMYGEDGHNLRHMLSAHFADTVLRVDSQSLEWRRSLERSLIEISFYAILGGLMSLVLWLKFRRPRPPKTAMLCFSIGFAIYAIAAIASATRNIFDWYATLGASVFDWVSRNAGLPVDGRSIVHFQDPIGFWFMDYVFEESLELIGASLICGAVLGWWSSTGTRKRLPNRLIRY